jgi:hypothetical protein
MAVETMGLVSAITTLVTLSCKLANNISTIPCRRATRRVALDSLKLTISIYIALDLMGGDDGE